MQLLSYSVIIHDYYILPVIWSNRFRYNAGVFIRSQTWENMITALFLWYYTKSFNIFGVILHFTLGNITFLSITTLLNTEVQGNAKRNWPFQLFKHFLSFSGWSKNRNQKIHNELINFPTARILGSSREASIDKSTTVTKLKNLKLEDKVRYQV